MRTEWLPVEFQGLARDVHAWEPALRCALALKSESGCQAALSLEPFLGVPLLSDVEEVVTGRIADCDAPGRSLYSAGTSGDDRRRRSCPLIVKWFEQVS